DLEIVQLELEEELSRTTLKNIPVMAVSGTTGQGLDELKQQLDSTLQEAPPAEDVGRPRLWIDRVFTIKGSGTVVTGTLTGGTLTRGDEVEILPDRETARIRAIQSHKKSVDSLVPGNRTAVNLIGLEQEELRRGEVLTRPGAWKTSDRIIASVRFLPGLGHELTERGAFKLHIGSLELDASMRFLSGTPRPGEEAFAAIRLDRPTAFDFKDRFILRDSGRRETLGGGLVLESHPASMKVNNTAVLAGAETRLAASSRSEYFEILLNEKGYLSAAEVPLLTGLSARQMQDFDQAVRLRSFVVSPAAFDDLSRRSLDAVAAHQQAHPMQPGMPLGLLRSLLEVDAGLVEVDAGLVEELLDELSRRGVLASDTTVVRTPDFAPQTESPEKLKLLKLLQEGGASPPMVAELQAIFGRDLLSALVRSGELVQVSPEIVYPAGWIAGLKEKLAAFV
ncbi:MAG: EF-Tu/IF-2/RF-3 family GTPase, partial [Actinomycetota bacterium]